jgi:hypothetical protein
MALQINPRPISQPLGTAARWFMLAIVIIGMSAWWMPSYRTWGSLMAGWVLLLLLWILHSLSMRERQIPGHPLQAGLLALSIMLLVHVLGQRGTHTAGPVADALGVSMLLQLALLAAGIALCQSVLPRVVDNLVGIGACAVAMIVGAICALLWTWHDPPPITCAWALTGYAGVCLWLTPICLSVKGALSVQQTPLQLPLIRTVWLGVPVAAVSALLVLAPRPSLWALTICGAVLSIGSALCRPRSRLMLASCLAAGAGAAGLTITRAWPDVSWLASARVFGTGPDALAAISGQESGLAAIAGATGWAGLAALCAAALWCLAALVRSATSMERPRQLRALLWTAIVALAFGAWLGPGGMFAPSTTLLLAVAVGLSPTIMPVSTPPRSAWWVMAWLAAVASQLLWGQHAGLGQWAFESYGIAAGKHILPGVTGFLIALTLAWIFGTRSWRRGAVAALAAAAAPATAALAQQNWAHWTAALSPMFIGALAACPVYLLVMLARWEPPPPAPGLPEQLLAKRFPMAPPPPPPQKVLPPQRSLP